MKMNFTKTMQSALLTVLIAVSVMIGAKAQPLNDDCANAILITEASDEASCIPVTVSTTGATQSAEAISCSQTSYDDDVWYQIIPISANVVVKGTNKSFTEGIGYTMYAGSCGGTQTPECEFRSLGDSLIFYNLTVGQTYFLRTFTSLTAEQGTFDLCVYSYTIPPPPANDDCANAAVLTSGTSCVPTAGTLAGATESAPPDSCTYTTPSTTAYDVWYQFQATDVNQTIFVDPNGSNSLAAVIQLHSACGGSFMECKDPPAYGAPTKLNVTGLAIGTTYYVRTYAYTTSSSPIATPTFNICVYNTPPPPANDDCANAIAITAAQNKTLCTNLTAVNTVGATQNPADSVPSCAPNSSDDDVWYQFAAVDTGMTIWADSNSFTGGITSVGMAVFDGSCSGVQLACDFSTHPDGDSLHVSNLIVGNTYYLDVFSQATTNQGSFNICVYGYDFGTGLSELDALAGMEIVPNPSTGKFFISGDLPVKGKLDIEVTNILGQTMAVYTFDKANASMDLSSCPGGTYFVKIKTAGGPVTKKVMISR